MLYLWIALGSGLGGVARFALGSWIFRLTGESFPWGTIAVNLIGCIFIGWFATFTGRTPSAANLRYFVMTGVCGGFTTFSSFSLETLNLARDGQPLRAGANVVVSVLLCLIGVWAGHGLATAMTK